MRSQWTWWAVGIGALLALISVVIPIETAGVVVVGWTLVCAISIFNARNSLDEQNRWFPRSLAVILAAIAAGNVLRALDETRSLNGEPNLGDLLQLPAYVALVVVAYRMLRARAIRRDLDAWLDAIAIALAMFIVLWVGFLGSFMLASDRAPSTLVLNASYNFLSVAALAIVLRITATPGRSPVPYRLIGVAYTLGFISDTAFALSIAEGPGVTAAMALSPIAFGFATGALHHPAANEIFSTHNETEESIGTWRILVLGLTTITPILFSFDGQNHDILFRVIAATATVCMAIAVFFRIFRLLVAERRQVQRERVVNEHLAQLSGQAPEAIRHRLPQIANQLFPSVSARIGSNATIPSAVVIDLGDSLTNETSHSLIVTPTKDVLRPSERQILHNVVRDASLIAASSEAVGRAARLESEAEASRRIASNERRFRALVQNASDVVAVLSSDGEVTYISESCEKVLGYPADQFLGRTFEWIADDNDWEFAKDYLRATLSGTQSHQLHETRATHCDGSIKLLESVITDMRDVDGVEGLVVNISDVTEQRTLERNLRDAETTDALTLLLNRNAFVREADSAIRRASVAGHGVAMAIVNLDDFRVINEGYGTNVADEVLVELSHRVRQAVRLNDSVARLNGDEFGILMPDGYTAVEAEGIVERILDEIIEVISIAGHTIALRATAGLVMSRDGSASGISLLRDADTALDAAKQTNRGGLVHFEEAMGEEVSERVQLRNLLHDAIREGKLRLAFQPVVDIETGAIVSMEALARWTDPVRGEIGPSTFIPIAEATGMISELGEWALRTACTHVVEWAELGFDDFTVSVNMSGHQLREENVIAHVKRVLDETGVDPRRITIEITESVLIDDTDFIADRIRALRQLGLRLAIDDFGTGYSSLSYLRRYEFDVLKIDRSFVIPLSDDTNKREREIVNAMIKLAQALGAVTVAEGIEESEEYAVLRTLGCDFAQGFLFWYPTESEDVIDVLSSRSSKNPAA